MAYIGPEGRDGRVPITGKDYRAGIRTNREPTIRFQGGAWVGSGLREEKLMLLAYYLIIQTTLHEVYKTEALLF
jgi:hypothetical protein